jgi:hypothetical protein
VPSGQRRPGDKVTLAVSDEDRKDATTTIASEAIRVLPEADKLMAGRKAGDALTNLAAAAADVTLWIRLLTSVPRNAAAFVARAAQSWRSLPVERRALPSPKLLLEAAAGYAAVDDDELKTRYERLLESALDVETAPRVHPAFPTILGEMTGVEARLLDYFTVGGSFESLDAFITALALPGDPHVVQVGLSNLVRLGLITLEEGPPIKVTAGLPAFDGVTQHPGEILIGESIYLRLDEARNIDVSKPLISMHAAYHLTPIGRDFLVVVGAVSIE